MVKNVVYGVQGARFKIVNVGKGLVTRLWGMISRDTRRVSQALKQNINGFCLFSLNSSGREIDVVVSANDFDVEGFKKALPPHYVLLEKNFRDHREEYAEVGFEVAN